MCQCYECWCFACRRPVECVIPARHKCSDGSTRCTTCVFVSACCVCVCARAPLQWTPEHRNSLSLSYRVPIGSRVTLYLEAWDEDIGFDDDLIGMGEVDVSDLVVPGAPTSRLLCALADAKREEDRGVIVLTAAPQGVAKPYVPPCACVWAFGGSFT